MEAQFRELVKDSRNFDKITLEAFSALSDDEIQNFFDTSTIDGLLVKGKVLVLRNRFRDGGQGNSAYKASMVSSYSFF
jgi:hypothetical protein